MPKFFGLPAFPFDRYISIRQKAQAKHFFTPVEHHKTNYNLRSVTVESFKPKRQAEANPTPQPQEFYYYGKKSPRRG